MDFKGIGDLVEGEFYCEVECIRYYSWGEMSGREVRVGRGRERGYLIDRRLV